MPSKGSNASRDVWRLSPSAVKLIILGSIVGALFGFAAFQLYEPRWTARLTVQVGQLSRPERGAVTSRLIENQQTAADRYNLPSSREKVLSELGLPSPDAGSKQSRLIFSSLRASTGRSPELINLEVSAYSHKEAEAALETSFKLFAAEHRKLFDPSIRRMNSDLAAISVKLKSAEKDYASSYVWLESSLKQKNEPNSTGRDVLLTNMALLAGKQTVDLMEQASELQEALDQTRSYPTRAIGNVYTPERPSSPGLIIFLAAGVAIGALFGCVVGMQLSARHSKMRNLM